MPAWIIRAADQDDLDALIALEARFPSDRLSRASLRRLIRRSSAEIWVADCDRNLAGDVVVLYRRRSGRARLYSLVVNAARTGQGIGRALLCAAEQAARRRGCREMTLEVRNDNTAAISLYASAGYLILGHRDDFYQDGRAALLLTKSLAAPDVAAFGAGSQLAGAAYA